MAHVSKRRIDGAGRPLGTSTTGGLGKTLTHSDELHAKRKEALAAGEDTRLHGDGHGQVKAPGVDGGAECGSCYGAAPAGSCCNTCEQVRDAYRTKGWSFDPAGVSQCEQAGFVTDLQASSGEGCSLLGYVQVPKVSGELHFAPSHSFSLAHTHVRDLGQFAFTHFNNTHTWNALRFGPAVPGKPAPLNGHSEVLPAGVAGSHQYYLKVVPTAYTDLRGDRTDSNQYSVTQHFKHLDPASAAGLPGVFVKYDFSPIRVTVVEARRSLAHFITSLCAIIGGTVTVMSLLDKGLHAAAQWWAARRGARVLSAPPQGLL